MTSTVHSQSTHELTDPYFSQQSIESNLSLLAASDLFLAESSLTYRGTVADHDLSLTLSHGRMDVDYQPNAIADLIGTSRQLQKDRLGFQSNLNGSLTTKLGWRIGGGYYNGYANYRTLWLDEYYRQQFSRLTGYEQADPFGFNGLLGLRWEYLPATGIAEVNLSYQRSQIAPGYDRPLFQALERGRDTINTLGATLSVEHVLGSRWRGRFQFSLADTTHRSLRNAAGLSLNYTLSESWIWRGTVARTSEQAGFLSHSIETIWEHDWNNEWFVGFGGRFYEDNGDIENSLFVVTTAAPDLKTTQAFLSFRWTSLKSAVHVELGPYLVDYATADTVIAPFANLYRERNFFRLGFSYSYSF